ncbi:MAG: UDP-4-amino-4,6-dideoxy-N-acetyl-beta-L-altrosamine transaminase [Deltaproteobacteria bacterium]|nr:UDP-4-amino-4,6-dideoxy-N-acetyl-beta-L-altrosamine transaminase [Deltaproteobacteria bacterium]MDZ4347153.1 UDP-4-amino-4,6-dideoxy-N-acetyl-beta-L-altrosamine transaminase [Candidatus Binatia bacterium]
MNSALAIDGGAPVRKTLLPYGRQTIDEHDIQSVVEVLRSDWLTTGPKVREFERAFARALGAGEAVAVSSGTAALHAAMHALGVGLGDEVIVPALTFAASANCVVYQGATPVFADVDSRTLLIDPKDVKAKTTPRTRAVIAVDYAGKPCDYDALREITGRHDLALVADACHSLGGSYKGRPVGTLADLNVFSLHPVKAMTTGEGGMITTESFDSAYRMRSFRNHGVTSDHCQREKQGSWLYDMVDLGYNYRLSDLQCALGLSQLSKVSEFVARRRAIARSYDKVFSPMAGVRAVTVRPGVESAYHLYVVRLEPDFLSTDRGRVFAALRAEGIGVNVHYLPVYLHRFYRERFGTGPGLCPRAEAAYEVILSLPMFPAMSDQDVEDVIQALCKVVSHYAIDTRSAAVAATR